MTRSTHHRRSAALVRPLTWALGAGLTSVALWRSGSSRPGLRLPADPRRWSDWYATTELLDATAAAARTISIALVGYLLLAALLQFAAAAVPSRRTRRLAAAVTPRFLAGTLVGLVALTATAPVGASTPDRAWPSIGTERPDQTTNPPVMRLLVPAPVPTTVPPTTTIATPPTTTPPTTTPPATTPPTTARPTTRPPATAPDPALDPAGRTGGELRPSTPIDAGPAATSTWTVAAGDHLWSIADRTLTLRSGQRPDDAATAGYWQRLIDANRDRLVDPTDPSLIVPAQILVLPE